MNTINENKHFIEYPTVSKLTYKGKTPFIRIYINDTVLYGYYDKDIYLVELHHKPIQSKILLKNVILPDTYHLNILNQAAKQIRGIQYQPLFVSNNQYLCIGYTDNKAVSFILLTIDLNTKGYYEIQNIRRVE